MSIDPDRLDRIASRIPEYQRRATGGVELVRAAHIMEFAADERFLAKKLFPAQGSLLKALTLDTEHMTSYDYELYEEWSNGFVADIDGDTAAWVGTKGTPGDLMDRIAWCKAHGRSCFREILLLIGRRGSKGFIAGILGAWKLHLMLTDGDIHDRYTLDRSKRLSIVIFAGTKPQAIRNVFRDLRGTLLDSPWFKPYIAKVFKDSVLLFTPRQLAEGVDTTDYDQALVEIRASETTDLGQRGSAVIFMFLDEFAHLQGAGSTSNSTEIYDAMLPATAQFGVDGGVIQTTSPWDKKGQSWKTFNRSCGIDPDTGAAKDPDFFMVQLESDALYRDAEVAHTIPMWPGGPTFPEGLKPIFVFDEARLRDEAANPDAFAVEYRAQWRSSLEAYFPARFIDRLFAPYRGQRLAMTTKGLLGTTYYAAADPSLSQANFGFSICHIEYDEDGIPHVVYDLVHHWAPSDFPDGVVSYVEIGDQIFDYIRAFGISVLTFDHFNSAEMIERLNRRTTAAGLPKRCDIREVRPTHERNLEDWENFKTGLGHDIIHAPFYEQADLELRAVEFVNGRVQIPDSGDVRTRDVADAMVYAFRNALGDQARDLFARLSGLAPRAVHGTPPHAAAAAAVTGGGWSALSPQDKLSHVTGGTHKNMHATRRGLPNPNPARGGMPQRRRRSRPNGY